ncbi:hypothetical protein MNEG_16235, partial [Monoraphidium neglectum]
AAAAAAEGEVLQLRLASLCIMARVMGEVSSHMSAAGPQGAAAPTCGPPSLRSHEAALPGAARSAAGGAGWMLDGLPHLHSGVSLLHLE